MQSENKMATMPIPKLILSMSLPAMVSMLVQALYNVVDSIFVSRISEDALTAVSLAFPIQLLIVAAFVGLGIGMNANISRRLGQKNPHAAQSVISHGMIIGLFLSALVAFVGFFFTRPYFGWFTDSEYIISAGVRYTQIVTIFALFRIMAQTATSTLQGTGEMVHPMIAQLLGALFNIFLDPILIFGYLGLPAMGVAGAARATIISQLLSMIYIWYVLITKPNTLKPTIRNFSWDITIYRDILKVGLPAAIMQGLGSIMLAGVNGILAPFGKTALAVMGVYFKLQSLVFMPIFGLNTGTLPVVGFNFGAKDKSRVTGAVKFSASLALVYMSLSLIVFQLFPNAMLGIFDASAEMLRIGIPSLRIISLGFPFVAITIILSGALTGLNKAPYSLVISLVRQFIVLLPIAFVLGRLVGIDGVWFGFVAAEIVGVLLTLFLFSKAIKQQMS